MNKLNKNSVLDWWSKLCPFDWNWDEPTFFGRLIKVLTWLPATLLWCAPSVIILLIHGIWMLIFYLVGEKNINKSRKQLCALGKHKWEEHGSAYHHLFAYANYCIYCGDCQNLSHPHAKHNKYLKKI